MKKIRMCCLSLALFLGACSSSHLLSEPNDIVPVSSCDSDVFMDATITLLRTQSKQEENSLLSPYAYFNALGITQALSEKESLQELNTLLGGYQEDVQRRLMFSADFFKKNLVALDMHNTMWLDTSLNADKDQLQTLSDRYLMSAYELDLSKGQDTIIKQIEKTSDGKLSPKLEIAENTKLVLVNTLQYEQEWEIAWARSEDQPFYGNNKETVVPMMEQVFVAPAYLEDEVMQLVDLPFKDGLSLRVVLPKQGISFDQLDWNRILTPEAQKEKQNRLHLTMPLIHQQTSTNLLHQLPLPKSMEQSFQSLADNLQLSLIQQDVCIDLDEYGASAVATTIVKGEATASKPEEMIGNEIEMKVNRPFLYMIVDPFEIVLFSGVIKQA